METKESILIVDDDESTCKTLEFIFNKKGYHVETVGTGNEALEIAQHKTFNLALLDIKLPDVAGIELLVPLKKLHSDIKLIIMTAYSSFETVVRALNEGASGYITKPLNLDDILDKIDNIFETQHLVAEKKKLEQELQYQAMLVENVSDAIISTDINLSIRSWNKGAEFMYGWKSNEIIGKPMSEIIPEEVPYAQNEVVKEHIFKKGFWRGEIIQRKKDNTIINIFSSATLIKDSSGKIQGVVIINQDITDRKKSEVKIVSLARFPSENPNPVLRVTKEKVIYANKASEELFNLSPDVKLPELFRTLVSEAIDEGITILSEVDFNKKNYSFSATPIKEEGYVNIYGRDISERKKKEEELRLHGEIITNMSEGVYLIKLEDGIIVYTNPAFEKMFGYDPGEMIGKNVSIVNAPTEKAPEEIREEIMSILIETGEWHGEIINIKKDRTPFWCYANVSLFDHPKYGTVMVSIHTDITERKKAEALLRKTMKDLKNSNTELEQFAYVASHDLQEPLRMVASFTQLLQDRYKDKLDEDANDFINFAVDGATRMQNLINDLLIFSRVGFRGKPFKSTDMNVVIENVLNNFRQLIKETHSMIIYDPLPVIEADESQMIQLFQNLISNGIKFRGEKDPIIHVTAEIKADKWIFTVKDNGIGIDTKFFDRIFIIFQRLHKKSEYGGTGIGLAVCKKIVQRHGGKIWVDSEFGNGSSFHVSIKKRKQDRNSVSYK